MPDLGPLVGSLLELLAPALRVLVRTTAGMVCLAIVSAIGSFYLTFTLSHGSMVGASLSALWALAVLAVLGTVLAVKRAVAQALLQGFERLQLGARALQLVFGRLQTLAGHAERLPLVQAEERLGAAITALCSEPAARGGIRGWLSGQLQARLFALIHGITLARFRKDSTTGVDLTLVRDELASNIDRRLGQAIAGGLRRTAAVLLIVGIALAFAGAAGLGWGLQKASGSG